MRVSIRRGRCACNAPVPGVWMKLITERDAKIKVVEADFWLPINDKEQLAEAERMLSER